MKTFIVRSDGANRFGLRELCQRYIDEQWVVAHATPDQAAAIVLDTFKRAVAQELELLGVECREEQ